MNKLQLVALATTLLLTMRATGEDLQQRLAVAKPGETIELPAGEFKGGMTLPPGVSLKGAGFEKTIIDATGSLNGIVVEGGSDAQVSDLTVRNAQGAAVTVRDAKSFALSRVRVTKSSQGVAFRNVQKGRIENCLSDHNSFGIAVSGGTDCAVVNCTVASCSEIALSLASSPRVVAFNNCLVGSAACINIDSPQDMQVDHNLYFGVFLGQMKEQYGKRIVTAWNYLTGLDAHSLQSSVEFKDLDSGNCAVTTVLPWALDRAATGDWGVAEFAGVKASETDMQGHPRVGRPDIGAVETTVTAPRAADGQFTVSSDVGLKSAGVFTKEGFLVGYLFQNQPLPKGTYSFWLPSRNYVGLPIPAGDYEVRLAESDFKWKYLNHVGDNGEDRPMPYSASFNPAFVAFAPNGLLIMQEDLSEDHTGIRAFDAITGKLKWYVAGGNYANGMIIDKQGMIYATCEHAPQQSKVRLTRVDSNTGKVVPWPGVKGGHLYPTLDPKSRSLAVLGDLLYAPDPSGGKLVVFDKATGKEAPSVAVVAPRYVSGDDKNNLLWVISADMLVAIQPDGTKVTELKSVLDPVAVTARDGQLVVASGKTGKLHWFDVSDPKNPKPTREFGRGDGPYGAIEPDRFLFQKAPARKEADQQRCSVALGPQGQFGVVDYLRTLAFDAGGKNLWYTIGTFGNQAKPSFSTGNRRMWETRGEISYLMNENDGTWKPEAIWDHSEVTAGSLHEGRCQLVGDFLLDGKTFIVAVSSAPGAPFGPAAGTNPYPLMTVARLDGFKSIRVLTVEAENGGAVMREDTNGDGRITKEDAGQQLLSADGKPLPATLFFRFNYLFEDGSVAAMVMPPMIWKCTGLNAKGVPIYEGKNYVSMVGPNFRQELSPYDLKPDFANYLGSLGYVVPGKLLDGGYVFQVTASGSTGHYSNNGAGTDLCAYTADGRRRWFLPLAQYKGVCGMGTADDITVTAVPYSIETLTVDSDGLQLGGSCEPSQLHYCGVWLDHPNLQFNKMPDGHLHLTYGDNCSGRYPWFRLDNQESLKKSKQPFHVSDERSKELAGLAWKPATLPPQPISPEVHVKRLEKPLSIDGDLAKWRAAGIEPQIVIGPSGSLDGPGDNSAVIRMAYEGQNLYFQILQFDDVPIFYQLVQQNSVELAINQPSDAGKGFQYVVHKNPEGQDLIWRNRFFSKIPQTFIDAHHAPRVIRVLENARDVPEREVLEGLYGEDMSNAKVIVTEFKLPIDNVTFSGDEQGVFKLEPGKTFNIGFFVDDNDQMYTDVQEPILWPATFGFFNAPEDCATAICD